MEGSGVSALSPKSGSGCCSLVSIRIWWSGMSLYEAVPFFSGTEGCVTQKVRREVSLQITGHAVQVFFAHGQKCTLVTGHCSVLLKDKKIELILERLEFCLSLRLPIKRQDQNPLGQKTGELKQKKNTGLILPNI